MVGAHQSTADFSEFEGKRVLVTGGTKGIGQAVATRLREGGAIVLTTAREQPRDLGEAKLFVATDLTRTEGCAALVDAVHKGARRHDIIAMSSVAPDPAVAMRCSTTASGNGHST